MEPKTSLGRSNLQVSRIGIGAMTWGQPSGLARWSPAQLSYGPSHGSLEEERALEVSLAAGVNLVDTAEMYSNGASALKASRERWRIAWCAWDAIPSTYINITFLPARCLSQSS
jgi:aryl-alcohol dehydrogenase-like predicted oxidoreductase